MSRSDKIIYKLVAEIIGVSLVFIITFIGCWWMLRRLFPVELATIVLVATIVGIVPAAAYGLWMRWRPRYPVRAPGPSVMPQGILPLTLFSLAVMAAALAGLALLWLGFHVIAALLLMTSGVAAVYGTRRLIRPVAGNFKLPGRMSERHLRTAAICASVGSMGTLALVFLLLGNVDAAAISVIMILPLTITLLIALWSLRK